MTTRNIKQFIASVNKLSKDEIKHTDINTIFENGSAVIVSAEHDEIVEIASDLRKLAAKLLSDERDFANAEVINRMTKDKDLMAQYALKLQKNETNSQRKPEPGPVNY